MAKLDSLLKKRADLEKQIAEAQQAEKRKSTIVDMVEKAGLLNLPDEILKTEFQKIGQTHGLE